jgi:hypothetical protein
MRAAVWLVCAAACCPPLPRSPTTDTARSSAVEVKTYAPCQFAADARAPATAAILGIDASDRSLVIRLAPPPTRAGEPAGLPATTWRAAIAVARALDRDIADITPYVADAAQTATGSVTIAVSALAAATAAPMDMRVAFAGRLELDGSLAPEPGMAEQLADALAHGARRFGYPAGTRVVTRASDGEPVDLVSFARARGGEAIELTDLGAAYQLATGKRLPEPSPLPADALTLDTATQRALDARYREWEQHLAGAWATLVQLESAGRLPAALASAREHARDLVARAAKAHQRGEVVAAYTAMMRALPYADATAEAAQLLAVVRDGDALGATKALIAEVGGVDPRAAGDAIRAAHPTTIGGHIALIVAAESARAAAAYAAIAKQVAAQLGDRASHPTTTDPAAAGAELADAFADQLVQELILTARARLALDEAATFSNVELAASPGTCAGADMPRDARELGVAAVASARELDARVARPMAGLLHLPEDTVRLRLTLAEPTYALAATATPEEPTAPGDLPALAGAVLGLAASEQLTVDHTVLDVELDTLGRVVAVRDASVLASLLTTAERHARAAAHAARVATGEVPREAVLAYQIASLDRGGDLDEQVSALAELWRVSEIATLAVALARQ